MISTSKLKVLALMLFTIFACNQNTESKEPTMESKAQKTAKDILGNSEYLAISYGGYRYVDHDIEPTMQELEDDMRLLHAMGIRILRTYKVHYPQAENILKVITKIREEDPDFEMYVMLGAWINCKNAFTDLEPDHNVESDENDPQIAKAVELAKTYPDIVKVLAVGNEAMVKWAASYYVQPDVILKWVNHLQDLKAKGELSKDLWITSSDNFASWGGGGPEYHVEALNELIRAVDYVSMHTYPMHDTHYNPEFWGVLESEYDLPKLEKIDAAMKRSALYAKSQYESVKKYIDSIGASKPIHIGETGWASFSNELFSPEGSRACDEYKQGLYHKYMREWTNANNISCFFFEAFNEPWKDGGNPGGSENHFGLFTVDGKAKYPIWDLVDKGIFDGLSRDGNAIEKTYDGNLDLLLQDVNVPPTAEEIMVNR
ncbi:MAG: glycosyl hydrolase family 17 protein [bacterium]